MSIFFIIIFIFYILIKKINNFNNGSLQKSILAINNDLIKTKKKFDYLK